MPRGKPKRGEFEFTIWLENGGRAQWRSTRSGTDADTVAAIRRYLLPIVERLEATAKADCAVDPVDGTGQKDTTRAPASSSLSTRVPPQETK